MAIALKVATTQTFNKASVTFANVDVPAGSNVLFIGLAFNHGNSQTIFVANFIPGDGSASRVLKQLDYDIQDSTVQGVVRAQLFYIDNPTIHANNSVKIQWFSKTKGAVVFSAWSGVDLAALVSTTVTTATDSGSPVATQPSVSVPTTGATEKVLDLAASHNKAVMVQGAGQTLVAAASGGGSGTTSASVGQSHEAGTGSNVVMDWTGADPDSLGWASLAIVLKAEAAATSVEQTFAINYEAGQQVEQTFAVNQEAIQQVAVQFGVQTEAVQQVLQTFAVQHESRQGVTETFALSHEALQQVAQTFAIFHESTGAAIVEQTFELNYEALQQIAETFAVQQEALQQIVAPFTINQEAAQALSATFAINAEALQEIEQTYAINHESTATTVITWVPYGPDPLGFRFDVDASRHPGLTWRVRVIISTTDILIPGNARLFNVTDNAPVANSQVVTVSTTPERKTSIILTLPASLKEYRPEFGREPGAAVTIDMFELEGR